MWWKREQPEQPETPLLFCLPLDVLHLIADHLAANDIACLTLCNRMLRQALGKKSSSLQYAEPEHREAFLTTIARDLPAHFYCYICRRLHVREEFLPMHPVNRSGDRCTDSHYRWRLSHSFDVHWGWPSFYDFTFNHLQLAMKRYYHGPEHGLATENLSYTEVAISEEPNEHDRVTTLLSVDAAVLRGASASLCLRIQHWVRVHDTKRNALVDHTRKKFGICYDVTFESPAISDWIQEGPTMMARCSEESVPEIPSGPFHRCRICNVQFRLDRYDFGQEGIAVVVTKWLDLGAGLSPEDPKWNAHFLPGYMVTEPQGLDDSASLALL
jgi:hypothetical protein